MTTQMPCGDQLQTVSHDELQAQNTSPSSSISFTDEPRTSPVWKLQSPSSSHPKRVGACTQLMSGPCTWQRPDRPEVAPDAAWIQAVQYSYGQVNFDKTSRADMPSPCIEQFATELLRLLSLSKERPMYLYQKRQARPHVMRIPEKERSLRHFGIHKSSKREKLYRYVRRRGHKFLSSQFRMLQRCLIEGLESSSAVSETSLVRRVAERHPHYPQLSQLVALVQRRMPIELTDREDLLRTALKLVQYWAPENKT